MIEVIDRGAGIAPIYRRTGTASMWFELEVQKSGKRRALQMRYTEGTTASLRPLVEPADFLLWADPASSGGGNTIRLTKAMVTQLNALPATASAQDKAAIVTNPDNQVTFSDPWNNELEALLITALQSQVVIGKPSEPARVGLYYDLKEKGMLDLFDISGMARFLAGVGVVENSITLSDNRTVLLTSLVLPSDNPVMTQLRVISMENVFFLIESLALYGLMPYLWIYGLFDFKTFCDKVSLYWPSRAEREDFVFQELTAAITAKQATALSEFQVDQLMKNFSS